MPIAFSGAKDVVLMEYARLTGQPFKVFNLDTGRWTRSQVDVERPMARKWRCSKDDYLDSKNYGRHMNRGHNCSRKPMESQTTTQSSSTVTSLIVIGGNDSGAGTFQSFPCKT